MLSNITFYHFVQGESTFGIESFWFEGLMSRLKPTSAKVTTEMKSMWWHIQVKVDRKSKRQIRNETSEMARWREKIQLETEWRRGAGDIDINRYEKAWRVAREQDVAKDCEWQRQERLRGVKGRREDEWWETRDGNWLQGTASIMSLGVETSFYTLVQQH